MACEQRNSLALVEAKETPLALVGHGNTQAQTVPWLVVSIIVVPSISSDITVCHDLHVF